MTAPARQLTALDGVFEVGCDLHIASTVPPRRVGHGSRVRGNPDFRVALTLPGELGRSRSPQHWAPGPPETSWIAIVKPLAAIDRGRLRQAAPGLAGRACACRRKPLLRRRTARRRAPASTVGLQPQVREDLLDHRLPGHRGPGVRQAQTVLRTVCVRAHLQDGSDDLSARRRSLGSASDRSRIRA